VTSVADVLAERIRRNGPITFAELQVAALYDPDAGFFSTGRGAGRSGRDFITSPEVGSLFGVLVARQLDATWDRLDRPDPFVVVDAGAGTGRLASDVLRAAPRCACALRYVLAERSPALRSAQRDRIALEPADEALGPVIAGADRDEPDEHVAGVGPIATSLDDLPSVTFSGLVLANELLDNLPVRIAERSTDGWDEVLVALDDDEHLVETTVPAQPTFATFADEVAAGADVPIGARLPVPVGATDWLIQAAAVLRRGELILVDYAAPVAELIGRGPGSWLRTYRGHERGRSPLDALGERDITCDLPLEHLILAAGRAGFRILREMTQAEWLTGLGIAELVEQGRSTWRARAHIGDLEAIAGRSVVAEAEALVDPSGLGAHRVIVLDRGVR
jgi:NADH dehydrogenase [ubiquinone] 1 alpha subcomplex assembly factor 7